MKHTENYTVRWHDTDAAREMRPSALMALMQETSHMQFLQGGRTLDSIRDEQGVGFILSRIALDVLRMPRAYESLRIETFTCKGHGYTFPRGFEAYCGDELVARCHSLWALVRIDGHSLVRVADFPLSFGDEPEALTDMPIRVRAPRDLVYRPVGERRIVWSDLDYNLHMNNTKYPDMVCDFLPYPEALRVVGISFDFCREAAFGDLLVVERADAGDGVFYFRTRKGEEICLQAMVCTAPRTESQQ